MAKVEGTGSIFLHIPGNYSIFESNQEKRLFDYNNVAAVIGTFEAVRDEKD